MFKNPFSFSGRIRRTEFGLSLIMYYAVYAALVLIMDQMILSEDLKSIFMLIVLVPMLWFMLAQSAKRCHDRGNTGWFQIIPFYVFWLLFAEGEFGINTYGPNPKGLGNIDEIDEIGNYLKA